jgi:anti-sigma B factor antagonist
VIDIEQSEERTPRILTLSGKLNSNAQNKLWRAVQHVVVEQGDRALVLDIAGIRECDSYGISELLRLHRSIKNIGGRMVVAGANDLIAKVFSITKVDTVLNLATDLSEAIASFPGSDLEPAHS